jgi:hypothetical protein
MFGNTKTNNMVQESQEAVRIDCSPFFTESMYQPAYQMAASSPAKSAKLWRPTWDDMTPLSQPIFFVGDTRIGAGRAVV